MILNALINLIALPIVGLISLLPDPVPETYNKINETIESMLNYIAPANAILPIQELITVTSIILTIEAGILLIKLVMWLASLFSLGMFKGNK